LAAAVGSVAELAHEAVELLPDFSPRLKALAVRTFDRYERGFRVTDKEIVDAIAVWQVLRRAGKWESS